ncbi:MAG: hypothetical protein VR72_01620 [Clostridiaceae bacterium BRH_c20a]|nr:MAG: hypothetical protein VR72_01620 [Clostridiaceae bacterium BRH_c20a]
MNNRNDLLKIIAIFSMTIDHIGWLFFPELTLLRIIGRFAFPIFAYQITLGYQKTKNIYDYMLRLFVFSIISQIPYMLLTDGLNIFFTLLIGLIMIYLKDKTNTIVGFFPLVLTYITDFDYGVYGLLVIYGFYIFKDNKFKLAISMAFLTIIFSIYYRIPTQAFSMLALPLIFYEFKKGITINKYAFYSYYPLHLLILGLIRNLT